ncbi:MAG: hypothetical protein OSJ62_12570 [Lachnospiraceae bacterium]|nr:hypothetical protein [Lachnospiraceae bacterium]
MKGIEKKWKQWSAWKRIVLLLLAGTTVILGMTAGLRIWDRGRQKPRVLAALKRLTEEALEQRETFEPLFRLIEDGDIEQEGYVNFEQLDADMGGKNHTDRWKNGLFWMEQIDMTASSIQYQFALEKDEQKYFNKADYQIAGIGGLQIEQYLTKEKLIVRIPQIHSSYLRMNSDRIKEQYRDSLLYTMLGEKLILPKEDPSVEGAVIFPAEEELEKINIVPAFLEEYAGRLPELWRQILVEKESETKQIWVNGSYENCSVFRLSVPRELAEWYIRYGLPEKVAEGIGSVCGETVDLLLSLDDNNVIRCVEAKAELEGIKTTIQAACYLKGNEHLLDQVQIDLSVGVLTEEIPFRIDFQRRHESEAEFFNLSISQLNLEKSEQVRIYFKLDPVTGESVIEYNIDLPGMVSDGEHVLRHLDQPIEVPDKEVVDIFELDVIEFLKFSRDFNFALFQ